MKTNIPVRNFGVNMKNKSSFNELFMNAATKFDF